MKAIVLGGGTVGVQVAKELIREGKDVVLIEKNGDLAQHLSSSLDCLVLHELGGSFQTLKRAGTAGAEFFIAVTGSDEVNLIACGLVAQSFPRVLRIARVRNPSYASFLEMKASPFVSVDHLINPERETAQSIVRAIEHGVAGELIEVGDQQLRLQPYLIDGRSPLADISVAEVRRSHPEEFLIPLVLRGMQAIIPTGETRLVVGDSVYFLGGAAALAGLFESLGREGAKKLWSAGRDAASPAAPYAGPHHRHRAEYRQVQGLGGTLPPHPRAACRSFGRRDPLGGAAFELRSGGGPYRQPGAQYRQRPGGRAAGGEEGDRPGDQEQLPAPCSEPVH